MIQAGKLSVDRWLNQIEKGRRHCYFLGLLIQEKTFSYTPPHLLVHGPGIVICEDNTLLGFTKMVHMKSNVLVNEPNLESNFNQK